MFMLCTTSAQHLSLYGRLFNSAHICSNTHKKGERVKKITVAHNIKMRKKSKTLHPYLGYIKKEKGKKDPNLFGRGMILTYV